MRAFTVEFLPGHGLGSNKCLFKNCDNFQEPGTVVSYETVGTAISCLCRKHAELPLSKWPRGALLIVFGAMVSFLYDDSMTLREQRKELEAQVARLTENRDFWFEHYSETYEAEREELVDHAEGYRQRCDELLAERDLLIVENTNLHNEIDYLYKPALWADKYHAANWEAERDELAVKLALRDSEKKTLRDKAMRRRKELGILQEKYNELLVQRRELVEYAWAGAEALDFREPYGCAFHRHELADGAAAFLVRILAGEFGDLS
jgi:hypothetical protein